MSKSSAEDEVDQHIIRTIEEDKPETVSQLVTLVKQKCELPDEQILRRIQRLQEKERIRLEPPQALLTQTLPAYSSSSRAVWYWVTLVLTAATIVVVNVVSMDVYPQAYFRNVLGTVFTLWFPGYTFIKALFPQQLPVKTADKDLGVIERVALSIGMSLAFVPLVGLLLNYTPWGMTANVSTLGLAALTVIFATAGVVREHQTMTPRQAAL